MQTIETILLFPLTWVAVTFAYVVYGQWRMLRLSKGMGEVGRAAQPLFPPQQKPAIEMSVNGAGTSAAPTRTQSLTENCVVADAAIWHACG